MKRRILSLFPLLLLSGCIDTSSQNSNPTVSDSSFTSSEPSSETQDSAELSFYAFNDYHGAVMESSNEPGIFRFGSYLREKHVNNPLNNSVLLNIGDYWQGSADSNLNRGAFLTEVGNLLHYDGMSLGNHEFDWYDEYIKTNKELAQYPFLGANIMRDDTNLVADELVSYDDTFKAGVMVERNGVNIGIIGTMGYGLESSILTPAVSDYYFARLENVIRSEVENLETLGADMIVLATHDSLVDYEGNLRLGSYLNVINEGLVDIIFSAHYHLAHNEVVNGIPVMQTTGYGKGVMEIYGTYDFESDTFSASEQLISSVASIKAYPEDPAIKDLFTNKYEAEIEAIKSEPLITLNTEMNSSEIVNLANTLMHDFALEEGYTNNDVVAVHNTGGVRVNGFDAGLLTYGDVYRAFPFDNEIRIIENISGSDLRNFISYNPSYPLSSSEIINSKTYTLVTIDYLSTNARSAVSSMEQVLTGEYVRDLIAEFFRD